MAGVPILPAYVKGTDEAMPKGAQSIKRVRISVYFGNMVEPQKLGLSSDRRQASQQLADHIVEEIKRLGEAKNKKPVVVFIYGPMAVGKLTIAQHQTFSTKSF